MPAMPQAQGFPLAGVIVAGQLPTRGINARDAAIDMQPKDALNLVNVLSGVYGMEVRAGYQEYAINLPGGGKVATIMSFYPGSATQSVGTRSPPSSAISVLKPLALAVSNVVVRGQIFACTAGQIFNVTPGGPGPWVAEPGVLATSDYWTWLNFQNAAGNFLVATNDNGMYVTYGGAGFSDGFSMGFATSATGFGRITEGPGPGQINGVNPDLFAYVMVWKRRLWFIEKESSRAWYLPVDQLTGTVRLFDFGTSFRHGGSLAALSNFTVDGGEGIDDYLVATSSEGDVVIYKGYDPDSADTDPAAFALHGIWFVGALPSGRRQTTTYGGDVYILSAYGISQVSKLLAMSQVAANLMEDISSRIDPAIATLMEGAQAIAESWYMTFLPHDEMLIIGVPQQLVNEGVVQIVLMIRQQAWSRMLDVPVACVINHGTLAFGGGDLGFPISGGGRVFLLFDNALDNVLLDGTGGSLIRSRMIPAYQPLGAPGMIKGFPMVRPTILAQATPSIQLRLLTDFSPGDYFTVPTLPPTPGALWNVARWDQGKWSGVMAPVHKWLGTVGAGFAATVQMDFVALGGTRVMSLDYWTLPGGPL